VLGVGGDGATALIVRPRTDSASSAVPLATCVNTRADLKDTRNGSVMSFPAIARCITQAGANDSSNGVAIKRRRRRVGSAAASCHRCFVRSELAALELADSLCERRIPGKNHE
jgi:hypothetical protein